MKKVRISQQQIAHDLGLSQTLVSMVLNGRRHGVSEESYRQIWSHAQRVGYRPKGMNSELSKDGQAMIVGYILRAGITLHSQNPFFVHLQQGLHETLTNQGISLAHLGTEDHVDMKKLKELYGHRKAFRGLVIFGEVKRAFVHALKQWEPRVISISAQYPGLCDSVIYDEDQAGKLLVRHLADLGHRDFAWLGGGRSRQQSRRRLKAVLNAARLHNLAVEPNFIVELDETDRMGGRRAAELILKAAGRRPTAWICYNGAMARGAVNYLLQRGLKVPADISVATFDHTRLCEEEPPTLTSASAAPEELGRATATLLLKDNRETRGLISEVILASELILRESTGQVQTAGRRAGPTLKSARVKKAPHW